MRELVNRKHAVLLYAVAMLVGTVGAARADTFFTVPNTGAPGGNFGTDPNYNYYSTTTDPSINPGVLPTGQTWQPAYLVNQTAWPLGSSPWTTNTGTGSNQGNWIGPIPTYMPYNGSYYLSDSPNTYYVYQTSFNIPNGVDLTKILITGVLASDNCTTTIGINGIGLGGTVMPSPGCSTNGDSFTNGHTFEIGGANANFGSTTGIYFATTVFKAGTNTIQFVVFNDSTTSTPNPNGLVVWDLQGIAQSPLATPEPAAASLMIAGIVAVSLLRRRRLLRSVR